jgi:hypothetical protein
MEIAFSLLRCHPERKRGTSPKLMDHTGWLTQDRLLDVWPISHSDYLCIYKIDRCAEKDLIEAM